MSHAMRWPVRYGIAVVVAVVCASGTAKGQDSLRSLDNLVSLDSLDTATDDLIRLSTEYATAIYELKKARLSLDTVNALRPNAVITNLEVQMASLSVEVAERKVRLLRAIAEKQLAAAQNKLEIIAYLDGLNKPAAGDAGSRFNPRQYIRVQDEATVEILKMILAMN